MNRLFLLIMFIASGANFAMAADEPSREWTPGDPVWVQIGLDEGGSVFFVDRKNIDWGGYDDSRYKAAWIFLQITYPLHTKRDSHGSGPMARTIFRMNLNCEIAQFETENATNFYEDGTVWKSPMRPPFSQRWELLTGDSVLKKMWNYVCVEMAAEDKKLGTSLRPASEIERVFNQNKGAIFSIYNRALRGNPSLEGKITLQVTVAPDGSVTECRVATNETRDPVLGREVADRVAKFQFSAIKGEPQVFTKPLDFFPQ